MLLAHISTHLGTKALDIHDAQLHLVNIINHPYQPLIDITRLVLYTFDIVDLFLNRLDLTINIVDRLRLHLKALDITSKIADTILDRALDITL